MALAGACARDPFGECADIAAGDLVITEFRGDQNPDDGLGQWLELYNASGHSLDLLGLKLRFRNLTGSTETPVIVRRSVEVAADGYVVLGLFLDDSSRPSYVDYGFGEDFGMAWLSSAAVDLESCGVRIDRATYSSLPKTGTYSFGGALDIDSNDIPAMWCTNATPAGTPQMANPPCP